jgi:copper chaperone CopZ
MSQVHLLNVGMTCEGCSGAVTPHHGKVDGVQDVECNVQAKTVKVTCAEGAVEGTQLVDALSKWSKAANKSVEYVGVQE